MLPRCVRRESVAANEFAFGVKFEQFVGHVTHRAFGFGLCLLPAHTAETVERWRRCFAGRITRNEIHSLDGHEKLGVLVVDEQHELAFRAL